MKGLLKKAFVFVSVLSLILIVLWQAFRADEINFYITSVCLLVLSMLPFFFSFERKSISPRELALVSTMIALAVASRGVFYLVPQIKPIAAVVIISAVCLGAERGYVIGAFSAFISNFIFVQGIWTPFQMVALGMVGLLSGMIFRLLKPNRITLSLVGFLLSFAVYGFIVDLSTVIAVCGSHITPDGVLSVYLSALPFNAAFGISTAVFLFLFAESFIKKINRLNVKYDLVRQRS